MGRDLLTCSYTLGRFPGLAFSYLVFSYRVSGVYTVYRLHVSEPGPWILHITFDNCGGLFAQVVPVAHRLGPGPQLYSAVLDSSKL